MNSSIAEMLKRCNAVTAEQKKNAMKEIMQKEKTKESTMLSEPKTLDSITKAELDAKLQHSYNQSLKGEGRPFEAVFDALE